MSAYYEICFAVADIHDDDDDNNNNGDENEDDDEEEDGDDYEEEEEDENEDDDEDKDDDDDDDDDDDNDVVAADLMNISCFCIFQRYKKRFLVTQSNFVQVKRIMVLMRVEPVNCSSETAAQDERYASVVHKKNQCKTKRV